MGPGGTLRMVFEADAWDSTISFAPGIPVTLGGTLELTFADDVNLASQVGRTFDLFDWTGVTPTGAFAVSSPYAWDLSNLYTTGEVTLTAIPEPTAHSLLRCQRLRLGDARSSSLQPSSYSAGENHDSRRIEHSIRWSSTLCIAYDLVALRVRTLPQSRTPLPSARSPSAASRPPARQPV